MWTTQRLLLLGVVGVLFAGCSGHRPEGYAPVDGRCPTVFRIDNDSPEAVHVFLHRGALVRLGTVPAWRSARLTSLAAGAPGMRVRLVARPVVSGGRSVTTDELLLGAGDDVRWRIMQPLEHSSITAVTERAGVARSAGKCAT